MLEPASASLTRASRVSSSRAAHARSKRARAGLPLRAGNVLGEAGAALGDGSTSRRHETSSGRAVGFDQGARRGARPGAARRLGPSARSSATGVTQAPCGEARARDGPSHTRRPPTRRRHLRARPGRVEPGVSERLRRCQAPSPSESCSNAPQATPDKGEGTTREGPGGPRRAREQTWVVFGERRRPIGEASAIACERRLDLVLQATEWRPATRACRTRALLQDQAIRRWACAAGLFSVTRYW
jgi:hypothetical protein